MHTLQRSIKRHSTVGIRLGATVLVAITIVAQMLSPQAVFADTDGYPWSGATTLNASTYDWGYSTCPTTDTGCMTLSYMLNGTKYGEADPWIFYLRNCTSYMAWKLNNVFGISVQGWGNATDWDTSATAHQYTVYAGSMHTPAIGEIAQWDGTTANPAGHVAYVYNVVSGVASLDEYNVPGGSGSFGTNRTTASGSAGTPDHYIHIGTVGGGGGGASQYHYQPFAADFNGDGYADIGLYDQNNGTFYIKHGPSFGDQISYTWAAGANYQPFVGDFNHDGYADIGLRDMNTGTFYIKHGPSFADQVTYQWAAGSNYQVFAADFNGDGYADIGLRDKNNGTFYIKHGTGFSDQISYTWAAGSNYQPFVGDFNGDRLADIGLYDQNAGVFYIKHGTGFTDQISYTWAAGSNYQPFAADFNGDGYADIGLRNADIGMFYIKHGTSFSDQITYQWASG